VIRRHPGWNALARFSAVMSLALSPYSGSAQSATQIPAAASAPEMYAWQQNLTAWRAQHETQVSASDGWLTLAGLEWLKPGVNTIGSAADNSIHLPAQVPREIP